jgi:hypothetical protein
VVLLNVKMACHSMIQEQLQHPALHIVARDSDFLRGTPLASSRVILKRDAT